MNTETKSLVQNAIVNFMSRSNSFEGTMTDLHSKLMKSVPANMRDSFPQSASALSRVIRNVNRNLSRKGISSRFERMSDGTRIVTIFER